MRWDISVFLLPSGEAVEGKNPRGGAEWKSWQRVLWGFFSQALFHAGLRPRGAPKLTGCDNKKGQRDCSHSSTLSIFLTAQCISWLQTPETHSCFPSLLRSQLNYICMYLTSVFHSVLGAYATLPVMVSASLKADARSTYSSSSPLNTTSGLRSQAGWFEDSSGGGAEERVHAGEVFGSSLAPSNYCFKKRRAMGTAWTRPCANGNKPEWDLFRGHGWTESSPGVLRQPEPRQVLESFTGYLKREKQDKQKSF